MSMAKRDFGFGTMGLREMSAMLGLSTERVRQLAAAGVLTKTGRDAFEVERSVKGYVTFLKEEALRRSSPAKNRLLEAKTRAVESRISRMVENVVEREEVEAVTTDIVATFREEFAGLGERSGAPAAIAARINRQITDATARCERDLRRAIARLE